MNPSGEGVVKYNMEWVPAPAPDADVLAPLLQVRQRLFEMALLGWDKAEDVGYGNVSIRMGEGFIISGTQTSGIARATGEHFTHVTGWDHQANSLRCSGPVAASSEALTHAMLYQLSAEIGCVLHVHHRGLWEHWMGKAPTTSAEVEYGTQAMAGEVEALWREGSLQASGFLVMRGHTDGVMAVGRDPAQALEVLLRHWRGLGK